MSDWWSADPVASVPKANDQWWSGDERADQKSPGESAAGLAKAAGVGVAKGGIGVAGLIGDLQTLASKGADLVKSHLPDMSSLETPLSKKYGEKYGERGDVSFVPKFPGSSDIQNAVESKTGEFYKPQTTAEKYVQTVGEFLPAAAAGPGGVARKVIGGAVVPGVASEAAGQATEGSALEPWARAVGAVGGGVGAALVSHPGSATNALRSQLPDFVTDQHIARAEQLIAHAGTRGINITWPEALSRVTGRPVMLDTQRIVENAPQSRARMDEAIGDRPQQIQNASRQEFDNLGQPSANPSAIGPATGEAAEGAINETRQRINSVAEPYYDRARTVLLTQDEMDRVRAIPGFRQAADAIRNDPHLNRHVHNLPEDSVGFLNEVKKHFDQQAKNEASPLAQNPSMQRGASISQSAGDVRDIAARTPHSQDYETALAIESHGREQFLEPLLRGPLGRIADKDIPTKKAIEALFPSNPLPNSQHEISTAVGAVANRNPVVASQLVRAHVESVFNEATQSLQGGPSQWGGSKFAAVLTGNAQQRENLRAAVEALPQGQARWAGFSNFLDILEATGKRQAAGSKTSFNTEELKGLSGGNFPAEAAKLGLSPGKWLSVVNDKWSKWQLGSNLNELAAIITNPASGRLLQQISRMPPGSREAGVTAARIIAQANIASQSGPFRNGRIYVPAGEPATP